MKYSSFSGVVAWSGGTLMLSHGQSIDEDHPLYKERPDLFEGAAPGASLASSPQPGGVDPVPSIERGTKAPGETRAVRVPKPGSGQ